MNPIITGTVWRFGDDVTAYDIISRKRWTLTGMDPQELGKWAFEGALPQVEDTAFGFKKQGCDIVVAGHDFGGGGKSIEHPIVAMQGAGVRLIVAESFSRYTFRNAINLALPAIICPGILELFRTGDVLEADLLSGQIKNLGTGTTIQGTGLTGFILDLMDSGGLLGYYRAQLSGGGEDK